MSGFVAFSHIAMSVRDLGRSTKFYTDVFGFQAGTPYTAAGRRVAALMEADPRGFQAVFLRLDNLLLELIEHAEPTQPDHAPRITTELGIAHLSFVFDDLADVISRLQAAGGHVRTHLTHRFGHGPNTEILFCTDLDGNRIELIQHPNKSAATAHAAFLGLAELGWTPASPGMATRRQK